VAKGMDRPLRCRPHFVEKVWGGRRMAELLGKELPDGPIGESWEISFRPDAPTPVAGGELDGLPLHELAAQYPDELLGPHVTAKFGPEGPLLLKFIDAAADLSVQVHPDEEYEAAHEGAEAKSEAWYVLAAEPGSRLIRGVEGADARRFRELLEAGRLEECLHDVPVSGGEVMDLPARTLHALGTGVLIAEIQQSSDTTYRVYDWNRVGLDGKPRDLHVEQALDVIDFSPPAGDLAEGSAVDSPPGVDVVSYIDGPRFVFERLTVKEEAVLASPKGRFSELVCIGGAGQVAGSGGEEDVSLGVSLLVPAAVDELTLRPGGGEKMELLRFHVA